ncbi:MAG: hypothetical protein ACRYG7_43485 [Janthinobacterium lividum]
MSSTSETPEPGGPHLQRALAELTAHQPDEEIWARIEAYLAADAVVSRTLPTLPAHAPDDDLWAAIAIGLDEAIAPTALPVVPSQPAVARPLWPARARRWAWALAASLLLLGLGWWQLHPTTSLSTVAHETVTFGQEASAPTLPAPAADALQQRQLSFIEAHCSSQPTVCQSGEFRTLRTQLQEVETQEARLRQDARRFGSSPELQREQARLVTLKASFTRQLVHLLVS